jgi:hypothetical protein
MGRFSDKQSKKREGQGQADSAPEGQDAATESEAQANPLDGLAVSADEFAAEQAGVVPEPTVEEKKPEDPPGPVVPPKRAPRFRVLYDVPKLRFKKGDILDSNHYDTLQFKLLLERVATEPVVEE